MSNCIIYFGNTCYPDKDASAHRTIGNGKALRELGYEVVFIGCRKGERRPLFDTKEEFCGFDIYYYDEPQTASQWSDYLFGLIPLKELLTHYQASSVILYNHPSISTKRIISFCHNNGIRVYADCTEWYDPKGFSVHTAIKKADTWYRMKHVNKHLDGIITISSYLQDYYINNGCKTICVPPLIDLSDKKWKRASIQTFHHDEDKEIKLIYVGNPGAGTKDKLAFIIEALNRVRNEYPEILFRLDIIGMNEEQFKEVFKMDPISYSFVRIHGRKPNLEALEFIKRSDYTIFLRDNNLICTAGFPTKFSESIACGTPVLTNLSSDLGKYLKDGRNGYVLDMSTYNALTETLALALSTPASKRKMMKDYCAEERTFDYHSFIDEFKKMF